MRFFKNYPLFSILTLLFLLVFIGGLVLNWLLATKAGEARTNLEQAQRQLQSARAVTPAPTEENLEQAEENLEDAREQLQETLATMRGNLQRDFLEEGKDLKATTFTLTLNEWVSQLRRQAKVRFVRIPENFAFGFSRFTRAGAQPPPQSQVAEIYKQKQIVNYLVRKLFDAAPSPSNEEQETDAEIGLFLQSIQREAVVRVEGREDMQDKGLFAISPVLTEEKAGAVQTMAFRIQFVSRTNVMRQFLKEIATFDHPLVIQSVEVEPAEDVDMSIAKEEDTTAEEEALPFSIFGMEQPEEKEVELTEAEKQSQIPVVDNNYSQFTITIEYVDIVEQETNPEEATVPNDA